MVLAIGDDNDGLAHTFLLGKTMAGHIDGSSDISTLCSNHGWTDTRQEHLG